jgi:hypothetical protein
MFGTKGDEGRIERKVHGMYEFLVYFSYRLLNFPLPPPPTFISLHANI